MLPAVAGEEKQISVTSGTGGHHPGPVQVSCLTDDGSMVCGIMTHEPEVIMHVEILEPMLICGRSLTKMISQKEHQTTCART